MTCETFVESVPRQPAADGLSQERQALWADAQGDWNHAHELRQQQGTAGGDRIHAYLHHKEADAGNASYWYHCSGEKMSSGLLKDEWIELVQRFLKS